MPPQLLVMTRADLRALNRTALDPARSVVVEAVAGSGKTWLLVSRAVRLLIDGVEPSEILAITFTRKAAQEMAARLREWLYFLATADESEARDFLLQREVPEPDLAEALKRARLIYERFLTAQPPITIATFHSWFLQLLKRAPLEAGALGDVNLTEQTGALIDEAWERFGSRVQREPEGALAQALDRLFRDYGLDSTRKLLRNFLLRRADWWAYTRARSDPVAWALERIAAELNLDPGANVLDSLRADATLGSELNELASLLDRNRAKDQELAAAYRAAAASDEAQAWFDAACTIVLTQRGTPRLRKASTAQAGRLGRAGEARLLELQAKVGERMVQACVARANLACYRANEAALACGVALLEAYQAVKAERQTIDYGDIEWHAYELVSVSEHAVYMHYKLDSRYRHILLDEFQDTNPLQWLTLKSWFAAAAEADAKPVVFLVGDPKQSIYRFRRAEARLFTQAARYLETEFGARTVLQQESRRCAPAVIEVVNRLFSAEPEFERYQPHSAHHAAKPGRVEVLPLVEKSGSVPDVKMDTGVRRHDASGASFWRARSTPDHARPRAVDPGPESMLTSSSLESEPDVPASIALRNPLERALEVDEDKRREDEAAQLVTRIHEIVGHWHIADDEKGASTRPAGYKDIMILVKRRTHLAVYEHALRDAHIPFITSRQGGLLSTLEAQDMVALLEFIVSPFADLKLAHALRSPIFGCSDEDLIALAQIPAATWWARLGRLASDPRASPALLRAHALIARWLAQSDGLPVHDQLDRIYFEADVLKRYGEAAPEAMRDSVLANLHAFMQRALDTDAGRYPSLPRFLHELVDLAAAPAEEAPDEGIVGDAGDAVRIYTVHGAKGLESPIVWLIDAAAGQEPAGAYDVMVDWPPEAGAPAHFSVCTKKAEQSVRQQALAESEGVLSRREDLNLLYVAMTRAQQALIVSGCDGKGREDSWYEKVRGAVRAAEGFTLTTDDVATGVAHGDELTMQPGALTMEPGAAASAAGETGRPFDERLIHALPTGTRCLNLASRGERYGTHFHRLMERLTGLRVAQASRPQSVSDHRAAMQRELGLSDREFGPMWDSAQRLLTDPALARFFDPACYVRASNEVAYVSASGEVRRIDRLVELENEVWVLDYKTGEPPADIELMGQYEAQMKAYRAAMAALAPAKRVRGLLVFSGGVHRVIGIEPPPP